MRKLSLIIALFACLGTSLSAQSFGLRAGLNATDASYDRDDNEIDIDGETNLMLGIFANLPLGTNLISIQPELNYLNRGYSGELDVPGLNVKRTLSYIDLGLIARLNFGADEGLGFYVGAGPQLSYAVSGQVTRFNLAGIEEETDVDFDSERINRGELQFAAVGGVTFDLGIKLFLEGRYNGSFTNQSDLDNSDVRQRYLGVNGGIMVPLGN